MLVAPRRGDCSQRAAEAATSPKKTENEFEALLASSKGPGDVCDQVERL